MEIRFYGIQFNHVAFFKGWFYLNEDGLKSKLRVEEVIGEKKKPIQLVCSH
jgi:hypothetical protein